MSGSPYPGMVRLCQCQAGYGAVCCHDPEGRYSHLASCSKCPLYEGLSGLLFGWSQQNDEHVTHEGVFCGAVVDDRRHVVIPLCDDVDVGELTVDELHEIGCSSCLQDRLRSQGYYLFQAGV